MALRRAPVPGARLMISDSTTKAGLRKRYYLQTAGLTQSSFLRYCHLQCMLR